MSIRKGITQEQINEICDRIYAQTGRQPTLRELHDKVAGGSMNALFRMLRVWRVSR